VPRPYIYPSDQGVPLWAVFMTSQHMLQCCCQLVAVQGHHTIIMVTGGDDHSWVLPGAPCWGPDVVHRAVGVDVGEVLGMVWVAVVAGPCMTCKTAK